MTAVPATKGRQIGEILVELGFASEQDVARATVEHERSGQPLGQILVDLGCITRLELASALAEQWSDQSASIKLLPVPHPASPARRSPEPHDDDDQYAARLQDAVAELAQRVGASPSQPTEELDDRVTDLAERVEATVARTQRIEATLATLAEGLEGVTGGVEEAFAVLQSGMAGLALDLARIDTIVAELTIQAGAASEPDPALTVRLEELGAAVAALGERPVADPAAIESHLEDLAARVDSLGETDEVGELRASLTAIEARIAELGDRPVVDPAEVESRLRALAARVENVVTPDEVVALHESLVAFEQRLAVLAEDAGATAALEEQARSLRELRATVAELESRPVGDPELDERLARIEAEFAERLGAKPDTDQLEAVAARLAAGADEHESLATTVAQLGMRIDEMAWRDDGDAASLEQLQGRVEALASTLTDLRESLAAQEDASAPQRLDELGQSLGVVRDEVAALARAVTPAERIDEIANRVADLAAESEAQQALGRRLDEIDSRLRSDTVTPADLARALAGAREDLTPAPAPLADPRVDELARELASLRDSQAPDPRVDRLAEDLREVRARLAEVPATPEPGHDPLVHDRLEALATRIDELASASPVAPDGRIDRLVHDVDAIRDQLASVERTPTSDPVVASELDALSQRLRSLDARIDEEVTTSSEVMQAIDAIRAELGSTAMPIGMGTAELERTIGGLMARVDSLAEAVATAAPNPTRPAADELQRLVDDRIEAQVAARVAERIDDLTRDLEARLAAAEAQPRTGGPLTGDTSGLDDLHERNRMTIERLGLHLGEHDRALAELMQTRNLSTRLEELAARVEELATGAATGAQRAPGMRRESGSIGAAEPSSGEVKALMRRVEDAEVASQADREKLMNRLERMATSIDWRLQRLEATETNPE
jgi:DNA repair exonuclease SbcCD ATPase subunit